MKNVQFLQTVVKSVMYVRQLLPVHKNTLQSDCLRRESKFLALTPSTTALCVCVCCIARVCDCVMVAREPYVQIMQHKHMHKAVIRPVEAKKLLSVKTIRLASVVKCWTHIQLWTMDIYYLLRPGDCKQHKNYLKIGPHLEGTGQSVVCWCWLISVM